MVIFLLEVVRNCERGCNIVRGLEQLQNTNIKPGQYLHSLVYFEEHDT